MLAKTVFLYLSTSQGFKNFLARFNSFNNITRRFVAGEDLESAAEAVILLNKNGIEATFDHLGEDIKSEIETREEVREYLRLLGVIKERSLASNVSVKLTQLGLDISPDLCFENALTIVREASLHQTFVRIDMEDSTKTDLTLDIFRRLRRDFDNVGIVIQSYLRRSEQDLDELLGIRARIRLCKGAYDEPASVAFASKADTDSNYVRLMKKMLVSGIYHGIATHDEKMIEATKQFAQEKSVGADAFEFQMLFGIRRDLQEALVAGGYRMRVYVPYGRSWYPYFMRRLAERPANVWFVLRNILTG